jgi:hypothetical protein
MSKTRNSSEDDFDSSEILSDPDFQPEAFVDAMEGKRVARSSLKRVDDLNDQKWLRAQLADWEDWD